MEGRVDGVTMSDVVFRKLLIFSRLSPIRFQARTRLGGTAGYRAKWEAEAAPALD